MAVKHQWQLQFSFMKLMRRELIVMQNFLRIISNCSYQLSLKGCNRESRVFEKAFINH